MRLFVGIELGARLAAAVDAAVTRLRSDLLRCCPELPVRFVKRGNLHLTLAFIGEVPDGELSDVCAALEPLSGVGRFDLRIAGFGAFPASGPLRVIWMGVTSGARELSLLHDEVGGRLARLGHAEERRPYSPHLTVARVGDSHGPAAAAARDVVGAAAAAGGASSVDAVTLFRSRLSAQGPAYEVLMRVPLLA